MTPEHLTLYRPPPVPVSHKPHPLTGQRPFTVVVVGVPRGGTSCAASVLDALNIYMGEPSDIYRRGAFENPVFMDADVERWKRAIPDLNESHPVWGIKNPRIIEALDRILPMLTNPHLLFISRDIVSIADRWIAIGHDHAAMPLSDREEAIRMVQIQHNQLITRYTTANLPKMLVSYERMTATPALHILAICNWLGLSPSHSDLVSAIHRVGPGYAIPDAIPKGQQ